MKVDVTTSIVIDRPRSKVAKFAIDPDNAPRWYANIESVEWLTPRPLALGSRIAFVARLLRKRMEYTYLVADLARGFSRIAGPMLGRAVRKANEKDLAALKAILEKNRRK